jgi:hypothetical protein
LKKVDIDNITDGMELAMPIHGPNGAVLMRTGAKLTSSLAQRLKSLNIPAVFIQSEQEEEISEEAKLKVKKELETFFGDCSSSAQLQELFTSILQYRSSGGQQ